MTCRPYFGVDNFEMAGVAMEMEKKAGKFKVHQIGWNFTENLYRKCQNGCHIVQHILVRVCTNSQYHGRKNEFLMFFLKIFSGGHFENGFHLEKLYKQNGRHMEWFIPSHVCTNFQNNRDKDEFLMIF